MRSAGGLARGSSLLLLATPQATQRTAHAEQDPTAHPELSVAERKDFLSEIVQAENDSDQAVAQFIETNAHLVTEEAARLRSDYVADKILGFAETDRDGLLQGFSRIMESLSEDERRTLVERFSPNGHA